MTNNYFQQQILSIQSAVMAGAVGNDAAMPVYDYYRLNATRLDTVRLAAHPGFGVSFSEITTANTLARLLEDFKAINACSHLRAVQTGYFGEARQIESVAGFIADICATQPQIIYLLDPVLGDGGRIYVDKEIVTWMVDYLIPLADILTPNIFELTLLTGHQITDADTAIRAARKLLSEKLTSIFVTGVQGKNDTILDILVFKDSVSQFSHKRKNIGISGSGDVLSAVMLAHILNGHSLENACDQASHIVADMIAAAKNPLTLAVKDWFWQKI